MNDSKKMKDFGAERILFLDRLSDLVSELDFKGSIKGEPSLPDPKSDNLSLEEIARIQVMMGFPDRVALALELGANPSDTHQGTSLRRLNEAYTEVHGAKVHTKMLNLLDQYGAEVENRKKPRSTKT
ncbi:hypothetical protein [Candidatus Berkiella aquae]|uniref:Uncharacterized protein n=1 Tax=Candidatus Berkiella aquae TaxID=295108 RepID=A0A0Q9YZT6_9GAMM|nr:hypothetical protein [Candidatus Berkiella aquae]MCS5712125.1 hypothetical protein [Candidatus Berkiella aquae]